ncbi:MAG: hypothetical protein QM533_05315 [Cytophagales bacterium]|nr:hypothetical protein [Cytophagales bacterium]
MELVQMICKELERYALIKRVVGKELSQSFAATAKPMPHGATRS